MSSTCCTAIIIILANITALPAAFAAIITGAFSAEDVAGRAIGALIQGFKPAAFSNEAGVGSASIAHSAVRTNEPNAPRNACASDNRSVASRQSEAKD